MPRHAGGKGGSGHKHHVKKLTTSRYRARLQARGLTRSEMTVYRQDRYSVDDPPGRRVIPAIREVDRPKIADWLDRHESQPYITLIAAQRRLYAGPLVADDIPATDGRLETVRLIRRRELHTSWRAWRWVAVRDDSDETVAVGIVRPIEAQ